MRNFSNRKNIKFFFGAFAVFAFYFLLNINFVSAGYVWTETQIPTNYNQNWPYIAASSDGSKIFTASYYGGVYKSSDYGATWTELSIGNSTSSRAWWSVASDSDGSFLMAGIYNGRLYISSDSGATWATSTPGGKITGAWWPITSDSDGSNLLVGVYGGRIYVSSSSGATWATSTLPAAGNQYWKSVASDDDGSFLMAAVYDGSFYISSSSGAAWATSTTPAVGNQYWRGLASNASGTVLAAAVYGGYIYVSSSSGATWATSTTALGIQNWESIASDSEGSRLIAEVYGGRVYISSDYGSTWTEVQPAGNVDKDWQPIFSSSDGSLLYVGDYGGSLYTSSDYGSTWTKLGGPVGHNSRAWLGAGSNVDGSRLIIGAWGDALYMSSDYGVTWTETQPAGDKNDLWERATSDSDGSNLMATTYGHAMYTSSDYGVTWTERDPVGITGEYWRGAASDADGSFLMVSSDVDYGNGYVYISSDSGATWATSTLPGAKRWRQVACDDTGTHLFAIAEGTAYIYTSSNGGLTWATSTTGSSDVNWVAGAANSSDASVLLVGGGVSASGRLYISTSTGAVWTERQPAGNVSKGWRLGAINSDGSHIAAGAYSGRLYISSDYGVTWNETQPAGDANKTWYDAHAFNSDGSRLLAGYGGGNVVFGLLYTGLEDTVAPVITGTPSDITWTIDPVVSFGYAYTPPTATDAIAGSVAVVCDNPSGTSFYQGTTLVTCTASDTASPANTSTSTFNVTVNYVYQAHAGNTLTQQTDNSQLTINNQIGVGFTTSTTSTIPAVISTSSQYSFSRNLKLYSKGTDVKQLQIFLNANGFQLAETGPGSPGNETEMFGSLTKSAVTKFQEFHSEQILKPLNLIKGTGNFYDSTRKYANGMGE